MTYFSIPGAVPLCVVEAGTGPFTPLSWSVDQRKAAFARMKQ